MTARRKSAHAAADATSAPRSAPRVGLSRDEAPPSGAERRGLAGGGWWAEGLGEAPASPRCVEHLYLC